MVYKKFRQIIFLLPLTLLLFSCQKEIPNKITFELNADWQFKETNDSNWLPAKVPGCVHTDLMKNGIIEDPYYRANESDVQWIDKKDWEYRDSFYVGENILEKDIVELNFEGLDTFADVFLNDSLVLRTDNMFRAFQIDCKRLLKEGKNELRVYFHSPIKIGLKKLDEQKYILPVSGNDLSELGGLGDKKVSVYLRKAPYHFGWDWGPRLVTSGVWKPITLSAWNGAVIRDVFISDDSLKRDKASLTAFVEIESVKEFEAEIILKIDSETYINKTVKLERGVDTVEVKFEIRNPRLWNPNGRGKANLYNIAIELNDGEVIDSYALRKGLRTIEVARVNDEKGESFEFVVNGVPLFAKGVNYIPQDLFLNRVKSEDYERTLKNVIDANMNMIRVWGGGVYERDLFYDICDEMGILVWQDFMFSGAMYPGDEEFLSNVKAEAVENVKRLRSHPSVALWCGNNELLSAWKRWGWEEQAVKDLGKEAAAEIWRNYEKIFHEILPDAVRQYDWGKFYWASSPSGGKGVPKNFESGDMHYWGVWWGKEPFENYKKEIPRFMSEFGFQSFPDINAVKKYSVPDDWEIESEVMKWHQRSSIGNVTIEEYMRRDYREPKNFEMFLYASQLLQARGITTGIEAHRRNMPYCMGSLYWQLNDCWPVASWSSVDYYGSWKALHYAVREAFKNVILSIEVDEDNLSVFVVSDSLESFPAALTLTAIDFYGDTLNLIKSDVIVEANKSKEIAKFKIGEFLNKADLNTLFLKAELIDTTKKVIDVDVFYFVSPKYLKLPKPKISYEINQKGENIFVYLLSSSLAKNVYLLTAIEGNFSDNYFDLLPNEAKTVRFENANVSADSLKNNLQVITLRNSY